MSEPVTKKTSVLGLSLSSATVMLVFTLVFTGLMAGTYEGTRRTIAQSLEKEQMRLINEVLPPNLYNNKLINDVIKIGPTPELGLNSGGHVWRARKDGHPVAVVLEVIAPGGYGGDIHLVVAVLANGSIGGVRVTEHNETPGLGDYIDPKKDKNKTSPWIEQFRGLNFTKLPFERWKVRKDGGDITYRTGATVSPRAVIHAVALALRYAQDHRDELYR